METPIIMMMIKIIINKDSNVNTVKAVDSIPCDYYCST